LGVIYLLQKSFDLCLKLPLKLYYLLFSLANGSLEFLQVHCEGFFLKPVLEHK